MKNHILKYVTVPVYSSKAAELLSQVDETITYLENEYKRIETMYYDHEAEYEAGGDISELVDALTEISTQLHELINWMCNVRAFVRKPVYCEC